MLLRKIIIPILLIFSAHFPVFSQKNIEDNALFGAELSKSVETTLSKKGLSPLRQSLSSTGQDNFAYNITLDFPPTKPLEQTEVSTENEIRRNEVIFCFMQDDFPYHTDEIIDFIKSLKEMERNWSMTILFSALDLSEFKGKQSVKGTEVFASSVDDTDSCCAITVSFNSDEKAAIYTGSLKNTTPLWLTRRITDSFYDTQTDYSFKDRLSAIYRLGIVKGKERLSFFLANEIPAIEINLPYTTGLIVLKRFAETYTDSGTNEWDKHYLYINRGNVFRASFVSERTIILICLSVGIFTILLLCVFSFVGEHGERHKYEFIKSSYMIPFTIGLSFLSLLLGQHAVSFLSRSFNFNPIMLYGIKIIFSMLFISILFTIQGILKISVTAFMYGYLLLVVSIFNIFFFTAQDLTLFVIFLGEYVMIYLSKNTKSFPVLCIFFLLMLLPFLPYGFIIIKNAEDIDLRNTVFATHSGNLLLALAIFPFQITWLRMLVMLNVHAGIKGYTMKKMFFNAIISTIAILAFCFAIIFAISEFIYRPDLRAIQRIEDNIVREETFTVSAKLTHDEFLGMTTHHVSIKSEQNAIHYELLLKGENSAHSIYDSIYDYTIATDSDGEDTYSFIIPDYPPKSITIDYAAPSTAKARLELTAYYKTDKPHSFRIEKRELKVE